MRRYLVIFASACAFAAGMLVATPAFAGPSLSGTVTHHKGNANLVVYVTKVNGKFAAPTRHPVMDQKKMQFVPHVMPVLVGTTVDFLNSDSISHNVFSPDHEGYNLGSWSKGKKRSYTFKHLGPYTQLCSIHPEMEAFIVVLQNPYYAVTDAKGHFKINLPAGHYTLKVWGEHFHSKDKKKTFSVDVAAGGSIVALSF